MFKFFAVLFIIPFSISLASPVCSWCIQEDTEVLKSVSQIAKLPPAQQLAQLRKEKICIKILQSNQKVPAGIFTWGNIEKPSGKLSELTKIVALMGKTLCAGEKDISKDCTTIALSSDAPRSTLIHEYLHTFQIARDKEWCAFSKSLWNNSKTSPEDFQKMRDKEWDVHKFLWKNKKLFSYSLEDEIAIASETLEEAKMRSQWDQSATNWVKNEGIEKFLSEKIKEYTSKLRN